MVRRAVAAYRFVRAAESMWALGWERAWVSATLPWLRDTSMATCPVLVVPAGGMTPGPPVAALLKTHQRSLGSLRSAG